MTVRSLLALVAAAAATGLAAPSAQSGTPLDVGEPLPRLERVQYLPREGSQPRMRGGVQGRFDYYALVLSWSPTHCETAERPDAQQCRPRDGRRYSFVLHGLWPQYERGFPESCPTPDRPFVPQGTIDRMADIMPSRSLIIHEYRKHGTCSGLEPESYYALSRKLYEKIRIPKRFHEPDQNQMIDTSAVLEEFVAANPGLKSDMLAVACGGPGNRLREVRICFTPDGSFRPCGNNENQRRLCAAPRVYVPPVRPSPAGSQRGSGDGFAPRQGPLLPGPVPPSGRNL